MCNLYSITTNQAAIAALFRVVNRYVGNLPPMPGVFPDYPAPVVRSIGTEHQLTMMRWGMPRPQFGGPPVTNIRNTSSPHWRGWLKPENRRLVPANSFVEYAPESNPEIKKDVVWFELKDDRPLFAFAGIWTEFKGDRGTKSKPVPRPELPRSRSGQTEAGRGALLLYHAMAHDRSIDMCGGSDTQTATPGRKKARRPFVRRERGRYVLDFHPPR
jgi:SOS response associated peptidase (SRAP)